MIAIPHFRLGVRVLIGFLGVMAIMLSAGAFGIFHIYKLNERIDKIVEVDAEALQLARLWSGLTEANVQRRFIQILIPEKGLADALADRYKKTAELLNVVRPKLDDLSSSPELIALKKKIDENQKIYIDIRQGVLKKKDGGADVTREIISEMIPSMQRYLDSISEYAERAHDELNASRMEADAQVRSSIAIVASAMVAATFFGVCIAFGITKSVTTPLNEAMILASKISIGDLTSEVNVAGVDELADLKISLKAMQEGLGLTISDLRGIAHEVRVASQEIAVGNSDLSNRTENAASSLEETSAAVHTLRDSVNENANATRQADLLAKEASSLANTGGNMVDQVIDTMLSIQKSSGKISEITKLIDGIAFQTNILALNAAIEAARAGSHGRGFAVVADEVRALAQRSATAAKEISVLINTSVSEISKGNELVLSTGLTINQMVRSVNGVTDLVSLISEATHAQAASLEEIGQAVSHLDNMTQQNAALVEQSAAAAASLDQQTSALLKSINKFKTIESGNGTVKDEIYLGYKS